MLCGAAGPGSRSHLEVPPLFDGPARCYSVFGANGAALGLLCAWLVDDRLAARRGDDRDNDLLGVYVIAAVLVLLSLAAEEANIAAAVGGAAVGALLGLAAAAVHPQERRTEQVHPAGVHRTSRWRRPSRRCPTPSASREPSACVAAAAPQLQRILAEALNEGGWFGEAHESQVRPAAAEPDEPSAPRASSPARRGDAHGDARRRGRRLGARP